MSLRVRINQTLIFIPYFIKWAEFLLGDTQIDIDLLPPTFSRLPEHLSNSRRLRELAPTGDGVCYLYSSKFWTRMSAVQLTPKLLTTSRLQNQKIKILGWVLFFSFYFKLTVAACNSKKGLFAVLHACQHWEVAFEIQDSYGPPASTYPSKKGHLRPM